MNKLKNEIIKELLSTHKGTIFTPHEIEQHTGIDGATVRPALLKMARAGDIYSPGRGRYVMPDGVIIDVEWQRGSNGGHSVTVTSTNPQDTVETRQSVWELSPYGDVCNHTICGGFIDAYTLLLHERAVRVVRTLIKDNICIRGDGWKAISQS